LRHRLRLPHGRVGKGAGAMTTTRERAARLRRRPRSAEITTPPAGTVLPDHARTGAPDVPVTSATPRLPRPGPAPAQQPPDAGPAPTVDLHVHALHAHCSPVCGSRLSITAIS